MKKKKFKLITMTMLTVFNVMFNSNLYAKYMPILEEITDVSYPAQCTAAKESSVLTGFCLLGNQDLSARSNFIARKVGGGSEEQPVALNVTKELTVGDYILYRSTGFDQAHEMRFTVKKGQITTIKTATLNFKHTGSGNLKLQHFQARLTAEDTGCYGEIGKSLSGAYLPGNYQVKIVSGVFKTGNIAPKCESADVVTFNVMQGQTLNISSKNVSGQVLRKLNIYRHSSSAYSLTNIGPLRHDVDKLGFLSRFTAFNGIYNPHASKPTDALVLSGFPNFDFVIPVKMNSSTSCGVSSAIGGLPSQNLLTECVFDRYGRLTRFRVNAGAFYGYNNVHGKSFVDSHTINSPFIVSGVKFNIKGN